MRVLKNILAVARYFSSEKYRDDKIEAYAQMEWEELVDKRVQGVFNSDMGLDILIKKKEQEAIVVPDIYEKEFDLPERTIQTGAEERVKKSIDKLKKSLLDLQNVCDESIEILRNPIVTPSSYKYSKNESIQPNKSKDS